MFEPAVRSVARLSIGASSGPLRNAGLGSTGPDRRVAGAACVRDGHEGDEVATLHVWEGTHRGPYEGIDPTDQHVRVAAMTIDHLRHGRLAESRIVMDVVSLLQQLGAIPGGTSGETPTRTGPEH